MGECLQRVVIHNSQRVEQPGAVAGEQVACGGGATSDQRCECGAAIGKVDCRIEQLVLAVAVGWRLAHVRASLRQLEQILGGSRPGCSDALAQPGRCGQEAGEDASHQLRVGRTEQSCEVQQLRHANQAAATQQRRVRGGVPGRRGRAQIEESDRSR